MRVPVSLPQRVSRLYPILALILAINSSILLYAWQVDQIKLQGYVHIDEREKAYQAQISSLLSDQKQDQAKLNLQIEKVNQATAQLAALQKELDSKSSQIKQQQDQLSSQQSQLSKNANELEQLRARPPLFSFQNKSSVKDVSTKEAAVKDVVTNAYDYIQKLYGSPYLLNSIVITFVDNFSIAGSSGEIVIENGSNGIKINIHLKDFDKNNFEDVNTIIHEMIHGFHGVAVFNSSALEEGMTVAATDAVMQQMRTDKKIPNFSHLYLVISPEEYKSWNNSIKVPADNDAFYSNSEVSKVYQLIGTAWYQLYQNDADVFKKINTAYYPSIQKGLAADNPTVLNAIRSSIKSVNNQSIDTYLAQNRAFNPN